MAKDATELGDLIASRATDARAEWSRLSTLQKRIEGKLTRTWMPDNADLEYKDLFRKSSSPWLQFGRDCIAQGLILDGYSSDLVWDRAWQANGMDGRQGAVNREVVGLGKSFLMTIPAETRGEVVMRPLSSLGTFAVFRDPWDEYPEFVFARVGRTRANFWDSEWIALDGEAHYRFSGDPRRPEGVRVVEHGLGYTPVTQLSNTLAIHGEPQSSVEAAIPVYQRIVDATFTLQMVQRYGAFPQKWMAGGEIGKNADGTSAVRSSVDSLLHARGESGETARFGTFEAANIEQVVGALDAHIKHLFAMCQVPSHYALGTIANLSAEAITAAESGYFRNLTDRQMSIGEGYEQAMRTAAAILGDEASASDLSSQVHWADVSSRSLAQISDAVVKLATVGAPLEMLFAMIPGWSKTDVIEAAAAVRTAPPLAVTQ